MEATMHSVKPVLKLFKISQNINDDWDTYDSAIVAAYTEEEARHMHPGGKFDNAYTWADPGYVEVEYIGIAATGLEVGVVIASFNAG